MGGGVGSKGRWSGKGERGRIGDGLGEWGGGRKDGSGSREVYISTKGAIIGFARDLILSPELQCGSLSLSPSLAR